MIEKPKKSNLGQAGELILIYLLVVVGSYVLYQVGWWLYTAFIEPQL